MDCHQVDQGSVPTERYTWPQDYIQPELHPTTGIAAVLMKKSHVTDIHA